MKERHMWLRDALAERSLTAYDIATAWNVHGSVVSRFIKTGTPKITIARVTTLAHKLGMERSAVLALLNEKPAPYGNLIKLPLETVAAFAEAVGMDVDTLISKMEW
jgi:plasmid maintenance system antidote protein VapI